MTRWIDKRLAELILLGFATGVLTGWLAGPAAGGLGVLSDGFVRLLQMVVGPLILATVITGIHEASRQPDAGRLAGQVVMSFAILTAVALALGLAGAQLLQPGAGLRFAPSGDPASGTAIGTFALIDIIPRNLFDALARGDTIQLVVFGLLFALAALKAGRAGDRVADALGSFTQILFALTRMLVRLAPLAAFGATAELIGSQGFSALRGLVELALVVLGGLAILALVVVPAYLAIMSTSVRDCWRAARAPVIIGFVTASGAAALPIAIESLVKHGVASRVASFVLPLGAVFNLSGSTLFVGAATLFLIQASGQSLTPLELAGLFGVLFVLTKAIPSVPRASLALIATAATGAGVPAHVVAAGTGALLAVDAILDMTRTAVNLWGHCAVATATAK